MGHKTLIGGTAYEIKGGKTLIGGTAYDIKGGKTLIGGTGYDISFVSPKEQTVQALFTSATLIDISGRNASTTANVTLSFSVSGTYYVLAFCNGYMSVNKVVYKSGTDAYTITVLGGNYTTSYGQICVAQTAGKYSLKYSSNGSSAASVRGATLAAFQFSDYTEAEADTILTALTYTRRAGRNSSSTATISSTALTDPCTLFLATNEYIALSTLVFGGGETAHFSNCNANPDMTKGLSKYQSAYSTFLSLDGTTNNAVYGGSMIQVA